MSQLFKIRQSIIDNGKRGIFISTGLTIESFGRLSESFRDIPILFVAKADESTLIIEGKGKNSQDWVKKLANATEVRIDNFLTDGIVDYQYFFQHINDGFLDVGILILDYDVLNSKTIDATGKTTILESKLLNSKRSLDG